MDMAVHHKSDAPSLEVFDILVGITDPYGQVSATSVPLAVLSLPTIDTKALRLLSSLSVPVGDTQKIRSTAQNTDHKYI